MYGIVISIVTNNGEDIVKKILRLVGRLVLGGFSAR
jgi:hypothetical protein